MASGKASSSLALFHRCEVEVVEAECLPASTRGGKPDPFVILRYPDHQGIVHRTKIVANSDAPVFGQKFVVESRDQTTRVMVQVFDRTDDREALLATGEIEVGPPARPVGCRWLPVASVRQTDTARSDSVTQFVPKVRLVWQCSSAMMAAEEVSGPSTRESANTVAMRLAEAEAARPSQRSEEADDAQLRTLPTSANEEASPVTGHVLSRLSNLEDTLQVFMTDVKTRLTRVEARLGAVEAFIGGRKRASTAEERKDESYWAGTLRVDDTASSGPASTKVAVDGTERNEVARAATGQGLSTLEEIRGAPTRVAAEDDRLVANYTFPRVTVPARHAGAAEAATDAPGAADRRLEATTKAITTEYRRMVKPM